MRRRLARLLLPALACALAAAPGQAGGGDPLLGRQYALTQLHAPAAWQRAQGQGVVVAVIDTGVDRRHPDLRGRLTRGATFLGCGATPCGDGDWRSGPRERRGDAFGHGTHVAGAVVAGRGNGTGIVGVAPLAKVMPVKIGDRGELDYADVVRGIRWAVDQGADVLNLSLSLDPTATEITDAVGYAVSHGVVVVAAAGNASHPICAAPGSVPEVVCVTATDRSEAPAAYTSAGTKVGLRSVAAPGGAGVPTAAAAVPYPDCTERILSTWPVGDAGVGRCPGEGGYRYLSGTSLASPHVAGVVALLLSQGRSPGNAVDVLLATARTPGVGSGVWTPHYGWGIADAAAAVAAPR
ncbi:MAG TPA: S8 family serine peptidase [Mycobacteriales bacterium]|jgi:serine protease